MTADQFRQVVRFFREGALARRNLYLWHGHEDALALVLEDAAVQQLSVLELLDGLPPASGDAAVGALLRDRLTAALERITEDLAVVVIRHCGLLARYLPDGGVFFRWLTARRMAILICPPVQTERLGPLPVGLVIEPRAVVETMGRMVPDGHVVEGMR